TPSTPIPAGPTVTAQAASTAFEPVTLSALSNDALVGMLEARVQYKKELFADAAPALEKNSALADMPPCRTRAEALAGNCLMTAALKRELQKSARPAAPAAAAAAPATAAGAAALAACCSRPGGLRRERQRSPGPAPPAAAAAARATAPAAAATPTAPA